MSCFVNAFGRLTPRQSWLRARLTDAENPDKTDEAKWAQQETIESLADALDEKDEQLLIDLRAALPDYLTSSRVLRRAKAVELVNGYRNCYAADAKNSFYNELATRLEVSPKTLQSLVDGEITGEHVCKSVKNNWPLLRNLSTVYQEMEALKIWNTPKLQYIDKTEFLENYQRAVRDFSRVAREQGITLDHGGKGDLTQLADNPKECDHKWAAFSNSSSGGSEGGSDP